MNHIGIDEKDLRHAKIYNNMKDTFQIEDMSGVEFFSTLARVFQLGEAFDSMRFDDPNVSLPRWRLLLHLFITEQMGNTTGLTPTELSHFRQVSKNTVSSLLRGLEEKGLIQRTMDAKDLRLFHIHLTDAGRQIIIDTAPQRINGLNQMLSVLSMEEKNQLTFLLTKLRKSLEGQVCQFQKDEQNDR
jgi:DNA-binding MarR family transcriptional regulator